MDSNHGHEAMQHAAMAAAAALSHPFFLAAAAASSRDVSHGSMDPSTSVRIPSFDDHHRLQSSPTTKFFDARLSSSTSHKRSLSPSFTSKQLSSEDNTSSFAKRSTQSRSTCFTPVTNNNSNSLSPISQLKIIAKGQLIN